MNLKENQRKSNLHQDITHESFNKDSSVDIRSARSKIDNHALKAQTNLKEIGVVKWILG